MNKKDTTQLDSITKIITILAATLIVILGMKYIAQDLIAPILMAFFLSILLRPLFRFYRGKGFGSGMSIFLVLITIVLVLTGLVILLTHSVTILQDSLSTYTDSIRAAVDSVSRTVNVDEETVQTVTQSISPESVERIISTIVGSLGNIALYLIVVPILALLLVLQMDSIPKHVSEQMINENPKLKNLSKFADSMMVYVGGRFKVNLITGLLLWIALLILNVEFAFFWGFMAVLLSFIPYLGIILAALFPMVIGFAEHGIWTAVFVGISVLCINLFAENILDPYVQGKGNKLSPAVVIISVIFWGWILGPVGMILSAPLTVLLKLIFSEYKETSWLAQIIEGDFSAIPSKNDPSASIFKKVSKSVSSLFKK